MPTFAVVLEFLVVFEDLGPGEVECVVHDEMGPRSIEMR